MTINDVLQLLEENKNERGIKVWQRTGIEGISTFGIGVTQLKKLAKKIKKDHKLAQELWQQPILDAKMMSALVDDQKVITKEEIEQQVDSINYWILSHLYTTSLLNKVPFQKELIEHWANETSDNRKRAAFLMLYNIARDDKKLEDEFFDKYLKQIEKDIQNEENFVKDAMNTALLMIGQRSVNLNKKAIAVAKSIGPVEVDYGDNSCQSFDCVKHLTTECIQKKLNK